MYLLGIETSCDETSCAIIEDGKKILSNIVVSQVKDHAKFSGVVPELASRIHLESINEVVDEAFRVAELSYKDISGVGVVYKPGLIGSLLVGLATAKTFAYLQDVPLIPVNHIDAHLYAPHLEQEIPFPNIGLVISGGHTLLVKSFSYTEHEIIGSTIDDAVGEAFDKIAKYYNLGYPGGPIIDEKAKEGNPNAFSFPKATFKNKTNTYQFSYSGLKTAVIHQLDKFLNPGYENNLENILASFQKSAMDTLIEISLQACSDHNIKHLTVTGGASSNSYIRYSLSITEKVKSYFASPKLCVDNGAMVAGIAYHLLNKGITADMNLNAYAKIIKKGKILS